jgi:hypothetical protein
VLAVGGIDFAGPKIQEECGKFAQLAGRVLEPDGEGAEE